MFGPSSVAGAPSNMQKAIENMCFDNFGVWTKELQGFHRVVQLLGIVGEPTGDRREELVLLGAMQTPQALHTDPKRWTGLRDFATAAAKAHFEEPISVEGVALNDSQVDAFMCAHGSPLLGFQVRAAVCPPQTFAQHVICSCGQLRRGYCGIVLGGQNYL